MNKLIPLAAVMALTFANVPVRAQEAEGPSPDDWKINVELHVITMPEKKAFALLPRLRDEKKINEAWAEIEAMVAKDDAKIVAAPFTSVTHGERLEMMEGEEIRYGVDFETPQIVESNAERATPTGAATDAGRPVSFTISQFEMRHVGIRLEADVLVSADGKRLVLQSNIDHTRLLKWDEFEVGRLANNEKILVKVPRFHVAACKTQCAMFSGERVLLGNHRVPDKSGDMELFILKVWTAPRKEAK